MPGCCCLSDPPTDEDGHRIGWHHANRTSDAVPDGFNQEDTIKAIWAQEK